MFQYLMVPVNDSFVTAERDGKKDDKGSSMVLKR